MAETGKLILIPTPIADHIPLEPVAYRILSDHVEQWKRGESRSVLAVEELRACRRRLSFWGIDPCIFGDLVPYNEHTCLSAMEELIGALRRKKDVLLMSDGGLPAFCDPGQRFIDLCHRSGIPVTSTPFANAAMLAIALSGFEADRFLFIGFLPKKRRDRVEQIRSWIREPNMIVVMDTPYRYANTIRELAQYLRPDRRVFIASDLNTDAECLVRCPARYLTERTRIADKERHRREFVVVIDRMQ